MFVSACVMNVNVTDVEYTSVAKWYVNVQIIELYHDKYNNVTIAWYK